MSRDLLDLLWRDHPAAPRGGTRGPQARVSTGDVVRAALTIADTDGLAAVTVRVLARALGVSAMAVYTHVGSRDDLLVLLADQAYADAPRAALGRAGWRTRVRRVAEAERALHLARPWLLDVRDDRVAVGPGTIATYDHQLHALDELPMDDVTRDAALTFVIDFARAGARATRPGPRAEEMGLLWPQWSARLGEYVGDGFPLARRVGAAAGQAMHAPSSPDHAWAFGLRRVLDALATWER